MSERDEAHIDALEDLQIREGIRRVLHAKKLLDTGLCHNCEEEVVSPERFCDAYCQTDYELRVKAQIRSKGVR